MKVDSCKGAEQKLKLLIEFGHVLIEKRDLDAMLHTIADFARELVEADRCSIYIYDKIHDTLWTKVAHEVGRITIPASKGVAGYAALSKEVQVVVDAYNDFRFNPDVDMRTGYITNQIIAIPLLDQKGETIGVLQVLNKKEGHFTFDDAEMLLFVANQASAALETALLYDEIRTTHLKLITKLSSAAEFKDEETSCHTKRVGEISALLAECIGLDEEKVDLIRATAPMHDIGKIGIPDAILLKKGPLDESEFEKMKEHTKIGYNILEDHENEFLHAAALIALEHHEHYDGNGYPEGKRGDEISLPARIVAVVDVFDALTSDRPYKKAWDYDKAFEYIQSREGLQFDPLICYHFIENRAEIIRIKESLKDEKDSLD